MPRRTYSLVVLCIVLSLITAASFSEASRTPEWGFFGHKRINRLAVFTLPEQMLPLFKPAIEYLTEHAVDADKRRYATKHEAVRHYIDIDHWGELPFNHVPKDFERALALFSQVSGVTRRGDTLVAEWDYMSENIRLNSNHPGLIKMRFVDYLDFFGDFIMPNYYDGPNFKADGLNRFFGSDTFEQVYVTDLFSEHGILPYNLISYQQKLTQAFSDYNSDRILRLAADIGHYIGDAHVPLHTTVNYNGQLTDQIGIHAFWESRIPELFADDYYDYFVGKAELIEDIPTFYWHMVQESHSLVDSVLIIEKRLSKTFPADRQYCFEDRNFINISQACPEYAAAYDEAMEGMVEKRFRAAIRAIGSAWYTAWFNAGQPDLHALDGAITIQVKDSLDELKSRGRFYGRQHWD